MRQRVIQGSFQSPGPPRQPGAGAHRPAPHVTAATASSAASRPVVAGRPSAAVQPYRGGQAFQVDRRALDLSRPSLGRPLPAAVQRKMEQALGGSFADVRVHQGPEAASIGALAFTYGSDLYFAPGQYNPGTTAGQRLLAHELTHVVQQRSGRVSNPFGGGVAVVQDPQLEAEAERAARSFDSGAAVQPKAAPGAVGGRVLQPATPLELRSLASLHEHAATTAMGQVKEIAKAIHSGKIGDTDELTSLSRPSTINSDGLAEKLEAISREAKGHYAEIGAMHSHLSGNKGPVILGNHADVTITDRDGTITALQLKYVSTSRTSRVNEVIGKAAEQLSGKHGEKPQVGAWLTASISLESHNPWPFDRLPGYISKEDWKKAVLAKVKRMRKKDLRYVERIQVIWPSGQFTEEGKLVQVDVFRSFFNWAVEIKSFQPFSQRQLGNAWAQSFTGF